ncbi:uncharacterized protein LOC111020003 [Momordica charantia]|uniref:Uncharacterized protein LOC111020003 n=1 Tax=Momordica charantia TaxID=3673 RepID=A0A6J1DDD0_MOMCH|nr:uncharacterized protein LOC111020003 [Momordica charantia]
MGSESISHQRHYDISMSKRTRKPAKIRDELQNLSLNKDDLLPSHQVESPPTKGFENNDHKSLKQLITGEGKAETKSGADEGGRGRSSLGQHFNEDKNNLQMVRSKQQPDGLQRVKLKKVVGKFLRNLIKGGDQHHLKKPRKKSLL